MIRTNRIGLVVLIRVTYLLEAFLLPPGEGQDEGIGNHRAVASADLLTPVRSRRERVVLL